MVQLVTTSLQIRMLGGGEETIGFESSNAPMKNERFIGLKIMNIDSINTS